MKETFGKTKKTQNNMTMIVCNLVYLSRKLSRTNLKCFQCQTWKSIKDRIGNCHVRQILAPFLNLVSLILV